MTMPTESCRMKVSDLQKRLATKATHEPHHRFTKLYDLLTWDPLMDWAFDTLMTHRGSRTAGIDGVTKDYAKDNKDRILTDLRTMLKRGTYRHQPVRRAYIPKANGKRRPLGIPTLTDRVVQMMVKAILDPIFESDFHQTSHGFRPNRSCHSAIAHLHLMTAPSPKKMYWVIEGDIDGCFDHVQHDILLRLLRRRIQDDKLIGVIHQMVKAGVMENSLFTKTDEGTPQGGVVSPLLANIYLHELDEWMHVHYLGLDYLAKQYRRKRHEGNAFYVRYADDFVVAWNGTKEGAEALKQELRAFLRDSLGLDLSEDKTAITHVTDGYDFLGFTIRRIVQPAKGYDKLLFYPSKDSVMKVKHKIKLMTKRKTTLPSVHDKIEALNYLLRGWGHYFRHSAASATLDYVGSYAFQRTDHWLRKKTGKRQRALYRRYYRRCERGYMTFIDNGMALFHPGVELKISYYRWRNLPNPYLDDPEDVRLPYHLDPLGGKEWSGDHAYGSTWTETRAKVRQRDSNRCVHCGSAQRVEVHHLRLHQPNRKHNPLKLVSLCRTCHNKARNPRSAVSRTLSRLHFVTGEPDDAKVSRPVREEA